MFGHRGCLLVVKIGHRLAPSLERGRSLLECFLYRGDLLVVKVGHRLARPLERGRSLLECVFTQGRPAGCKSWSPSSALAGARAQFT